MESKTVYIFITSMAFLFGLGYYLKKNVTIKDFCTKLTDQIAALEKYEKQNLRDIKKSCGNTKNEVYSDSETDSELDIIVEQPEEINPKNE